MANKPQSRISVNIDAKGVHDVGRLIAWLLRLKPTAVLVMDGLGLAQRIQKALADAGCDCAVIHRNYALTNGDEDLHKRMSPQKWIEMRGAESDGGIYLYLENEPGFSKQVIDWQTAVMVLAAKQGIKLVVGNWSTGTPEDSEWGMARELLIEAAAHPELFIVGLHEYGGGVMTSGLLGGYPDHAGVQKGELGGTDMTNPDNWPAQIVNPPITAFHCGRFHFLLNYCSRAKIPFPRIVITEHGIDNVTDITAWLIRLPRTAGYPDIRGWKSMAETWFRWWGKSKGWSTELAYAKQLAWADSAIYQYQPANMLRPPVIGQLIFCYGHSDEQWAQFDIQDRPDLLDALAGLVATNPSLPGIPVEPPPVPAPEPIPMGETRPYSLRIPLGNLPPTLVYDLRKFLSNGLEVTEDK